ncbi:MAG: hypothetical protein ACE5IM_08150 [Nitrospinota bacterium]
MSWSAIRSQLKAVLGGVPGIGVVHDYQRWEIEADNFNALFVSGGRINVWMVTRDGSREEESAQRQNTRRHQVRIIGLYALDDSDATEKTFSDLLEAVCDALRQNNDLGGTAESSGPPQVRRDDHARFAGTLCHFGEITVEVREDRTY